MPTADLNELDQEQKNRLDSLAKNTKKMMNSNSVVDTP